MREGGSSGCGNGGSGLLLIVLGWAAIRPLGWPETIVAVPAAVIVVGVVLSPMQPTSSPSWRRWSTQRAGLLGIAAVAALAANLINNLPAVLVLIP